MPISSKRIISFIKSGPAQFTAQSLVRELSLPAAGRRDKKRKTKKGNRRKDINKIDEVLYALHAIGCLGKSRKRYSAKNGLKIRGILRTNSSGNAVVMIDEGIDLLISREDINHAHNNDSVEAEVTDFRKGYFYGRVISIVSKNKEKFFTIVERKTREHIYYRIMDIPGEQLLCSRRYEGEPETGYTAIVKLAGSFHRNVQMCIVEDSFPSDTEERDIERVSLKHSLPGKHGEYRELDIYNTISAKSNQPERTDYRSQYTITIDGENAKDFDDAVSLELHENRYKLYVHIADVSSFLKKGTPLDKEAGKRGTSFYLGNSVIPMLPEILSNNFCSLREGEDRLTLSCEMSIDKDGKLLGYSFSRGVINVNRRLTYKNSAEIIKGTSDSPDRQNLSGMLELASILKRFRLSRGRVDLNLPDEEIVYEDNRAVDIKAAERLDSHMIIEEFMLSANEAAAKLLKKHRVPTLYRVHESIRDEKYVSLENFVKSLGLRLDGTGKGLAIQKMLDTVRGMEIEHVVNMIVLKSMMQACYMEAPLGHFGLGFSDYTHFTSPIRRYPDLVVHRCIKSVIDGTDRPYSNSEMEETGIKSSEMERVAVNAERDILKIKSCRLLADRVGDVFKVIVSGVNQVGLFVTLIDRPIEGMVPLILLTDDYYLVMEDDYSIIGKRRGKRYRIGDVISARLVKVDITMMRIDFEIV